jgi:hypothetical protein
MNDLIGFAEVLAGYFLYADTTMGIDVREHYSCSHTLIALLPLQTPFTSMRLLYYSICTNVKRYTPYNQILIFEEQLCMSNMDFYILD